MSPAHVSEPTNDGDSSPQAGRAQGRYSNNCRRCGALFDEGNTLWTERTTRGKRTRERRCRNCRNSWERKRQRNRAVDAPPKPKRVERVSSPEYLAELEAYKARQRAKLDALLGRAS